MLAGYKPTHACALSGAHACRTSTWRSACARPPPAARRPPRTSRTLPPRPRTRRSAPSQICSCKGQGVSRVCVGVEGAYLSSEGEGGKGAPWPLQALSAFLTCGTGLRRTRTRATAAPRSPRTRQCAAPQQSSGQQGRARQARQSRAGAAWRGGRTHVCPQPPQLLPMCARTSTSRGALRFAGCAACAACAAMRLGAPPLPPPPPPLPPPPPPLLLPPPPLPLPPPPTPAPAALAPSLRALMACGAFRK